MRKLGFAALIFIVFLVQTNLSVFGIPLELTTVLCYYFGLKKGKVRGMCIGAFIGIIEDGIAGGIVGPNMVSKGLVGFLSASMLGSFFVWTPILGVIVISALTIFDGACVYMLKAIFEYAPTSIPAAFTTVLMQALMNLFWGLVIRHKNEG